MCEYTASLVTSWETGDEFSSSMEFYFPNRGVCHSARSINKPKAFSHVQIHLYAYLLSPSHRQILLGQGIKGAFSRSEQVSQSACLGMGCLWRCLSVSSAEGEWLGASGWMCLDRVCPPDTLIPVFFCLLSGLQPCVATLGEVGDSRTRLNQ